MPDPSSAPDPEYTLAESAAEIVTCLRANGFPSEGAVRRQLLVLAEEGGEFVGAYRRWSGQARRTGTFGEMCAELADVVISVWVAAALLGCDLNRERDGLRARVGAMAGPQVRPTDVAVAAGDHVLVIAETIGAFVSMVRRMPGQAREPGDFAVMGAQLASVDAAARTAAEVLGIDLDQALADKLAVIHSRGWRDTGTSTAGCA